MKTFNQFIVENMSMDIANITPSKAAKTKANKIAKQAKKDDMESANKIISQMLASAVKKGRTKTEILVSLVKDHGWSKSILPGN